MKDKTFKIIKGFVLLFLFFNASLFQYIPFKLFHANVNDYIGNTELGTLLSVFADLILFAIIVCMYRDDIRNEFSIFKKNLKYNLDTGLACWGIGLLIMMASNLILIHVFKAEGANNEIVVRDMIHSLPFIMGLAVCFLAPFIEEFVFRKTLKDIMPKPILFILSSFLIFGAAHVMGMAQSLVDWLYLIPYGALGGMFAIAYYKTDTVFTSMAFHMIHNILVFLIVLFI